MSSWLLTLSCRLYRGLLHAYPVEFRNAFGEEMARVFRDGCTDALRQRHPGGLCAYWLHTLHDLIVSALREGWATMDRRAIGLLFLAMILGIWIGLVDFRSNEVQNAVLLIAISGFLFGLLSPRRAWRWALAIGLGVPIVHYVAHWLGIAPPYPVEPGIYASFIALIPAFIATYAGAFVRLVLLTFTEA